MSVIQFEKANCKNCYKCIRNCPVKAITFRNNQAEIDETDCMLCGSCLTVCPQNAKHVKNDIEIVKGFLNKKEKVYVSIAPSFVSTMDKASSKWLFHALKKLGFTHVEETAVGALQVSRQYEKLMAKRKMPNIITSACPSITFLIQRYYPELIDQLAPVVSPMIAHAKMLRETYGSRNRVVFIGPCVAKKEEFRDPQYRGIVDAVITFEELDSWLESEGIHNTETQDGDVKNQGSTMARIYPVPGGILKTMGNKFKKNYRCISIDGVDNCLKVLDSIRDDGIKDYFIEMNTCSGGCIGGPCIKHVKGGFLEARTRIIEFMMQHPAEETALCEIDTRINLDKKFMDKSRKDAIPSEDVLQEILSSTGKFTPDKELNCGACGYPSCRDKAIAVYNNRAQLHMCLPYMKERAESISSLAIDVTNKAIFIVDYDLKVLEYNPSACKMFGIGRDSMRGRSICEILAYEDFQKVQASGTSPYHSKHTYEAYGITVDQSIFMMPEYKTLMVILNNVSEQEKKRQEIQELRSENINLAQNALEKQMVVIQEIASLLGETTAETKVALTRLKKSMVVEEEA